MKKYKELISLNGNEPVFRQTQDKDFDLINHKTFVNKLDGLNIAQNFRFVWEKSKEYLKQINNNRVYKKLFKASLDVAKQDLEFGQTMKVATSSLEQKIKNTSNMRLKMKPN